jgi:hypothetical protein
MGFSSFKTSDTKKSIANAFSTRSTFDVHMITEDGQVFTEDDYQGYMDFGGKNVHVLIGELNGMTAEEGDGNSAEENLRLKVINLIYETVITNGERSYSNKQDFFNWEEPLEQEGGKTPNQLVAEGWKQEYPYGYGNFTECAKAGLKIPKFVETLHALPENKKEWKEFWDTLPYPEDCEDQGYFYGEDDDDDE